MLSENKLTKDEIIIFKPDIPVNLITMKSNSWKATVETQAIYENIFTNLDFYSGEKNSIFYLMISLIGNLVQVEKKLIKRYQEAIKEIETNLD